VVDDARTVPRHRGAADYGARRSTPTSGSRRSIGVFTTAPTRFTRPSPIAAGERDDVRVVQVAGDAERNPDHAGAEDAADDRNLPASITSRVPRDQSGSCAISARGRELNRNNP
jgi:hypothetical protein